MNEMALEPSPAPEATRFTEPWRASPATKMPGTLVSSRNGSRSGCQLVGRLPSCRSWGPERMKPWASRSTTSASHWVWGWAPMRMKSDCARWLVTSPDAELRTSIDSRWPSPWAAATCEWYQTSMFFISPIWSTRYCDIPLLRESPRTSITTRRAYLEKNMDAWPAELAPPTMKTSSSRQDMASVMAAP